MRIPLPRVPVWTAMVWESFGDWSNVPIYVRGWIEIRRLDVLLVIFGLFCVGYYGYLGGLKGALIGGATYTLIVLIALWFI